MLKSKLLATAFVWTLSTVSVLLVQPLAAQQQPPEHFQKTFTVSPGAALNVENYKGTIHVTAAEGNQVSVDVQKRFEGSDSDRQWWMDNVKIDFRNDPQKVAIKVDYPSCNFCFNFHDYTAQVELEIRVPRQTNIALDGYKPDIKISGVQGDITIKSYKSPTLIDGTTGSIRVDTYKDSIRLRNVKITDGLEVKSYKADLEVNARDLGQTADLETEKGSIAIHVPGNAGLDLDYAGGRRSSFHSDFNLAVASGSSDSIRGSINGGGTKLRLRTTKGSVTLQKISGEL
jgi:Putative adhesin